MAICVVDTVSALSPKSQGLWVFCGSHGGTNAAKHALGFRPAGVVFNDAGVGKDGSGIAGLTLLDRYDIPAAAVDTWTARIGDGSETLNCGVISHVNATATKLGIKTGMTCRDVLCLVEACLS
ncbi:MAG: hypothetical protein ACREUA_08800 [Burkholderiales bacterium]